MKDNALVTTFRNVWLLLFPLTYLERHTAQMNIFAHIYVWNVSANFSYHFCRVTNDFILSSLQSAVKCSNGVLTTDIVALFRSATHNVIIWDIALVVAIKVEMMKKKTHLKEHFHTIPVMLNIFAILMQRILTTHILCY